MTAGRKKQHGHAVRGLKSGIYFAWVEMRQRCANPNNHAWGRYGAIGVCVSPRWNSFAAFLEDVGPRPSPKHSLDRYPNKTGNYEPSNVRGATSKEQANNTRRNLMIEVRGEAMTLTAAVERYGNGIAYETVKCRIHRGVPPEKALGI